MADVTMAQVIARVDLLDGIQDRHYFELPLNAESSAGACKLGEGIVSGLSFTATIAGTEDALIDASLDVSVETQFTDAAGRLVTVDCEALKKRLSLLGDISDKLPLTRFAAGSWTPPATPPPPAEYFVAQVVMHMMSATLFGLMGPTDSLPKLLGRVPFDTYAESVRTAGTEQGLPGYADFAIRNPIHARTLFQVVAEKHAINLTAFDATFSEINR